MRIIAHRGAHKLAPENSIEAFELALELGANGIELDVRTTSDRVAVVMHDPSIERTTGLALKVSHATSAEMANARLANGEGVPTLAEVVERFAGRTALYIELKDRESAREAERTVLSKPQGKFTFSSFEGAALGEVAGARKALLWGKRGSPISRAVRLGCSEVHVRIGRLDAKVVKAARARQLDLLAWDVKSERDIRKALSLGLDGIIVDDVPRAREYVESEAQDI
jgi:glycerophosphoryl diester phosphodiesterase